MGARWAWHSKCEKCGKWGSGFSGGMDNEYCGEEPINGSPQICGGKLSEYSCNTWNMQSDMSCEEAGCFKEPPSDEEIEKAEIDRISAILIAEYGEEVLGSPLMIATAIVKARRS